MSVIETTGKAEAWYQEKDSRLTMLAKENLATHAIEPGQEAYHLGNPYYVTRRQMQAVCPEGIDYDRYSTLANGYVDFTVADEHWDDEGWWAAKAKAMWDGDTVPDEGVYWTEADLDYADEDQPEDQEAGDIPFELWHEPSGGVEAMRDHGRVIAFIPATRAVATPPSNGLCDMCARPWQAIILTPAINHMPARIRFVCTDHVTAHGPCQWLGRRKQ